MGPPSTGGEGQTWRIELAWDGREFIGWQRQTTGRSVQQEVETALAKVLGGESVRVQASGRTDAGVHALQQIAAFRAQAERRPSGIVGGLNHHLPEDISCLDARPVQPDFEPRRYTRSKLYRYRLLNRETRCPFRRGRVWHHPRRLDLAAMTEAAPHLVGHHDFSSFRAHGCASMHARRLIRQVDVQRHRDEVHFDFEGHGFLRHQVRIMVGTLLEVGEGRATPSDVLAIREARERSAAGPTAPGEGLWLISVECPEAGPVER